MESRPLSASKRRPGPRQPAGGHHDPLAVLGRLTPRDRLLVGLLAEQQVLTARQVERLAFPSLCTAQRRLLRLHSLRVLDRFRWNQIVGSQDWHYTLGPVGETITAAAAGTVPPSPIAHARRVERLANNPRLGHLLGINDVFTRLAGHARAHRRTALEAWWSERRCSTRCAPFVQPDGYGRWADGPRTTAFFFEYDTGSEPLTKVVAKLPGYSDLATAGGPDIPVLIWVRTTRRETSLHTALASAGTSVTVATASAELTEALGCGPAGPVWLTAPGRPRRTLAELGTPAPAGADRPAAAGTGRLSADPAAW